MIVPFNVSTEGVNPVVTGVPEDKRVRVNALAGAYASGQRFTLAGNESDITPLMGGGIMPVNPFAVTYADLAAGPGKDLEIILETADVPFVGLLDYDLVDA